MDGRIVIGKIIGAHGVRGEVKVYPLTDNVRRFNKLERCYLGKEGDNGSVYNVVSARNDRGSVLLRFDGVDDRDSADLLRGHLISVDREDAVKLPRDRFFIVDLIGLSVIDDDLGELGVISDVFETGANHIITVKRKGKKDLLIPFLKSCVYSTEPDNGVMRVRLPEGLYEIYE